MNGFRPVMVDGEVDFYTAPTLDQVLQRDVDGTARHVVVDLSAVEFIDSAALAVLVSNAKRLKQEDASLVLVCAPGQLKRLIEVTGLLVVIPVYAALDEALAAAGQEVRG